MRGSTYPLEVLIDKLTNSILNTISGDSFPTDVHVLLKGDLKKISRKTGWSFNWMREFKTNDRVLYKLTIRNNPQIIQGLISISDQQDHYFVHLIESAPFNVGKHKLYEGVPGNLIAFVCKISMDRGYLGFVAFMSKTKLIEHYEKELGATHIGGQKMVIFPPEASRLMATYFPSKP